MFFGGLGGPFQARSLGCERASVGQNKKYFKKLI